MPIYAKVKLISLQTVQSKLTFEALSVCSKWKFADVFRLDFACVMPCFKDLHDFRVAIFMICELWCGHMQNAPAGRVTSRDLFGLVAFFSRCLLLPYQLADFCFARRFRTNSASAMNSKPRRAAQGKTVLSSTSNWLMTKENGVLNENEMNYVSSPQTSFLFSVAV